MQQTADKCLLGGFALMPSTNELALDPRIACDIGVSLMQLVTIEIALATAP
jgi:hypothetical protein